MQSETPSYNGNANGSSVASGEWAAQSGGDPTLDLLQNCVEAMSILQAKFVGLEVETKIKLDAGSREIAAMRSALDEAKLAIDEGAQRLRDSEDRVARLEISAVEAARQHADDIAAARAEAATARMRGETDTMAFDHLVSRLTAIETGVIAKLENAKAVIAEREAEAVQLRTQTEVAQTYAERLQAKLRNVDATIADQRSRISCLQSKLATATYAIRMEHMAREFDAAQTDTLDRDILDLQSLGSPSLAGKDMISAA